MELNKYIDHTLLKPEATKKQITKLCEEARQYDFASVCVNTCYVPLAKQLLAGSDVKVCCVVGFPLGAMDTVSKAFEAKTAVENGAQAVDMVINITDVKKSVHQHKKGGTHTPPRPTMHAKLHPTPPPTHRLTPHKQTHEAGRRVWSRRSKGGDYMCVGRDVVSYRSHL